MTMNKKGGRPGGPAKSAAAKFTPRAASGPPPWSILLKVDTIPDGGLHRVIEASPDVCAAVAILAEVRAVSGLKATLDLSREGDIVHVTGRVTAKVGQNCVVTLEPLETAIDEPIDVFFAPVPDEGTAASEDRRRKTEEELPEPLVGGIIDLGAIACEFLFLGIEPYPRKEGVEFSPPEVEPDGPHPFAALGALKKPAGGGEP
ncbi:MAG: DUF177 domain-containing protein [Pseudolabrys sp.]|nr:DUF177 domain-containing protein [Pseudolabrys sp.]